jgi:hypothetical protein
MIAMPVVVLIPLFHFGGRPACQSFPCLEVPEMPS